MVQDVFAFLHDITGWVSGAVGFAIVLFVLYCGLIDTVAVGATLITSALRYARRRTDVGIGELRKLASELRLEAKPKPRMRRSSDPASGLPDRLDGSTADSETGR